MAKQQSISSTTHEDLSNWEFVNQSDCSGDFSDVDSNFDVQSFDLDDQSSSSSDLNHVDDAVHGVVGEKHEKIDLGIINDVVVHDNDAVNDVDLSNYLVNHQGHIGNFGGHLSVNHEDLSNYGVNHQGYLGNFTGLNSINHDDLSNYGGNDQGHSGNFTGNHSINDVDDHDDVHDDDDDGMDDDLVPWEMKGIYMRERIKKSEKRSLTKMCKSKKILKCVHGKYYAPGLKAY
ncbi:hypothetical protein RND81_09G171700 [Saponaria officinalis]|uniref:Uncharacterized protein n=1 Tax=Saponaria officinalis TaxID=3572 RepID=A0AAW1IN81_SAPOF